MSYGLTKAKAINPIGKSCVFNWLLSAKKPAFMKVKEEGRQISFDKNYFLDNPREANRQ